MRASGVDPCVGREKEGIDNHDGKPVSVELDGEVDVSPASSRDEGSISGNTVS
jgi:hypothetical protein